MRYCYDYRRGVTSCGDFCGSSSGKLNTTASSQRNAPGTRSGNRNWNLGIGGPRCEIRDCGSKEAADLRWRAQRLDAICRRHVETKLKYNWRAEK